MQFVKRIGARILLGLGVTVPGGLLAAGFTLTCQVLDPATHVVRNSFAPGETMLISYAAELPPEAADQEIDVKLSARLRLAGITIPYTLDQLKVSLPNKRPTPAGGTSVGELPWQGTFSRSSSVQIPQDFPEGTVQLRAKATIEGVGKQTCEVQAQIVAQPVP